MSAIGDVEVTPLPLTVAYSNLVDVYHELLAAHHGEGGPTGCPCCAEFRPRVEDALAAVEVEIGLWVETTGCEQPLKEARS